MAIDGRAWSIERIVRKAALHPARTRLALAAFCAILGSLQVLVSRPLEQSPENRPQSRLDRFRAMSVDAEARGLAEPFKGITSDGRIVPGLYAIRSTGVSTEPVRKAAGAFLAEHPHSN